MKRFRVYDKWLHETLEQSDTNDYSYRDRENMWICDITDALEDPARFVVQENTGVNDVFGRYIFEGDKVRFNVRGDRKMANGVVVRRESGTWVVRAENGLEYLMDDVFCDVKERGGK